MKNMKIFNYGSTLSVYFSFSMGGTRAMAEKYHLLLTDN